MRFINLLLLGLMSLGAFGADVPSVFNTTNRTQKTLSLEECMRQALERNHRIKVRRYDPGISRFTLAASRGIYDPEFSLSYNHLNSTSPGRFNTTVGTLGSGSTAEADTFNPAIQGYALYGLQYTFSGNFSHSHGTRSAGTPFDDYVADVGVALEQPLLKNFLVDARRTDIEIRKRDLQISELGLEEEVRTVIRDVQLAYFEVMFSLEDVKVQEKALELANQLASDNKAKVDAGALAPLDAKQAEAQAATALADLIQAQRRVLTAENILKNLITDDYQSWLRTGIVPAEKLVAVPERLDITESWTSALSKRPDLRQLKLSAEKLGLEVKLSRNQLLPELNVTGGYGRSGVSSFTSAQTNFLTLPPTVIPEYKSTFGDAISDLQQGLNPKWNIGAVMRIPLSRTTERNRYRAVQEQEKQVAAQMRKLNQDILVEVDNAMDSVRASFERVSATHQARLFAELALDAGTKRLEAGKTTSFEILSLQKDLTTARSNEIRALTDYNEALSLLSYRDGTILERNKISVQFK